MSKFSQKFSTSNGGQEETESQAASLKFQKTWMVVERSRHPQRPYALDYVKSIFSNFEELKGDRAFAEDPAIVCGVGELKGVSDDSPSRKVFFIGNQKGRNTKQKIERNFGMAKPEGYRKACRIMELAERFQRPIVTFIDTPGAFPGIGAEERGQSEAIATSILKLFNVKVPTVGVVIGEGGSGGALAIGVTDKLLMLQNSIYSVISPESCAAILWQSATEAKRAAHALKMSAQDCLGFGLADEIIPEPGEGAHETFDAVSHELLVRIHDHLSDLEKKSVKDLMESRFQKFRYLDKAFVREAT